MLELQALFWAGSVGLHGNGARGSGAPPPPKLRPPAHTPNHHSAVPMRARAQTYGDETWGTVATTARAQSHGLRARGHTHSHEGKGAVPRVRQQPYGHHEEKLLC